MDSDPGGHGPQIASLLADMHDLFPHEITDVGFIIWNSISSTDDKTNYLVSYDQRLVTYQALAAQPWFTRGWVVQEVGLASERLVIWGDGEFSWADFMHTVFWTAAKSPFNTQDPTYALPVEFHVHMNVYRNRFQRTTRFLEYLG